MSAVRRERSSDFEIDAFNTTRTAAWAAAAHWTALDRGRDQYWRGHRCVGQQLLVISPPAFIPKDMDITPIYYPTADYSYYDEGDYAETDAADPYSKSSEYDQSAADSSVSDVQSALSREGYYSGAVDGSMGPETQNALRRYQRDRGLPVTGRIDRATTNALGLK